MRKKIRLTESDLHRIIKESVNKILNEVEFGGESLHGNNPADWNALYRLRNNISDYHFNQGDKSKSIDHLHKSTRNEKNFADVVDRENAELGQDIYSPEAAARANDYFKQGKRKYVNMGKNIGLKPRY